MLCGIRLLSLNDVHYYPISNWCNEEIEKEIEIEIKKEIEKEIEIEIEIEKKTACSIEF